VCVCVCACVRAVTCVCVCVRSHPCRYEKAATQLARENNPLVFAKVDCTRNKELCDSVQVQGFPTVKLAFHQRMHDYMGPRRAAGTPPNNTTNTIARFSVRAGPNPHLHGARHLQCTGIVAYMKKIMTGLTVIVDTAETLATYTQKPPVMLGFFDSVESPGGAPTPRMHFLLGLLLLLCRCGFTREREIERAN